MSKTRPVDLEVALSLGLGLRLSSLLANFMYIFVKKT